jgi:hypothetical protein
MSHQLSIEEFLIAKEWAKSVKHKPRKQPQQAVSLSAQKQQRDSWNVGEHGRQFCSSTSLHGVQYLGEPSRHYGERLMRLLFLYQLHKFNI